MAKNHMGQTLCELTLEDHGKPILIPIHIDAGTTCTIAKVSSGAPYTAYFNKSCPVKSIMCVVFSNTDFDPGVITDKIPSGSSTSYNFGNYLKFY
jgi:hypothetical protein